MSFALTLAFLFFIGSLFGWCLELFYRNLCKPRKPGQKWINPGFCTGPYVPLYGFGLCILFLLALLEQKHLIANEALNKTVTILVMAAAMTVIEYIAGILCLKVFHVRLWDYSGLWGNVQGLICPIFSLAWGLIGAAYDILVHPYILGARSWLSHNLALSFFIGAFFGVFTIDVVHSAGIVQKIRAFGRENDVVVLFESIKEHIEERRRERREKYNFFRPFQTDLALTDHLRQMHERIEQEKQEARARRKQAAKAWRTKRNKRKHR